MTHMVLTALQGLTRLFLKADSAREVHRCLKPHVTDESLSLMVQGN